MTSRQQNSRALASTWPYRRRGPFVDLLKRSAARWFEAHDCEVQRWQPYCLANWQNWPMNIIVPEVASYIQDLRGERGANKQPFRLHDFVHHGLSSQALLFNLVGPLMVKGDLQPLRRALGSSGIPLPGDPNNAVLEYHDRSVFNEDSGQPTSVDLAWGRLDRPGALFIECKLVESRFGGCSVYWQGDCDGANPRADFSRCYLHHIGREYWSLLKKHGFLQTGMASERTCVLASHYQFFREVLFTIEKKGYFVLLTDDRSPTFHCTGPRGERGLVPFLMNYVPDQLKDYVRQVSIQEVVNAVELSPEHSWISEFRLKYGM